MKSKGIFLSVLVVSMLFTGCKKEENAPPEQEAVQTEERDSKNELNQNSEVSEGEMESEVDTENMGEGAPDSVPMDVTESDSYQIGDVITISSDGEDLYELTIDEIAFTDQRDEYTQDPGNVILVTYTYKNLSEKRLLIDDMRFQLMNEDGTILYDSYYLAEGPVPESVEIGKSCTAQISYASEEKPGAVVLAYKDTVHNDVVPVKITVNNLQ